MSLFKRRIVDATTEEGTLRARVVSTDEDAWHGVVEEYVIDCRGAQWRKLHGSATLLRMASAAMASASASARERERILSHRAHVSQQIIITQAEVTSP